MARALLAFREMRAHLGASKLGAATPAAGHARPSRATAAVRFAVVHDFSVAPATNAANREVRKVVRQAEARHRAARSSRGPAARHPCARSLRGAPGTSVRRSHRPLHQDQVSALYDHVPDQRASGEPSGGKAGPVNVRDGISEYK